jgi:bacterioferritin
MKDFNHAQYDFDREAVMDVLNRILENEMAGVVRYTHYSFMVYGPTRIPIVTWLREQANESLLHSQETGELITHLGEHPSLKIGKLLETHQHDIMSILGESFVHETAQMNLYRDLLKLVEGKSVMFEEFARKMVYSEELHTGEVMKMMRTAECEHPAPVH